MDDSNEAASPHYTSTMVGAFLVAFASIEALSYQVYRVLPDDALRKHGLGLQGFVQRVRFAQSLLRSSESAEAAQIEAQFEPTFQLASFRNQVAHNPPYTDVYVEPETGELRSEGPKWIANRTEKELPITIGEVKKQTEQATEVYTALARLIHNAMPSAGQSE